MGLEDLDQIDVILGPDENGRIALVIVDGGVTTDPVKRMALFKKKMSLYVHAILEDESLQQDCPGKTPGDFFIRLTSPNRPTEEMLAVTSVRPKGHPELSIPVEFEEYPEGAWGEEPADDQPPSERDLELMHLISKALEIGLGCLESEVSPLLVLYQNGEKTALTFIENCPDEAAIHSWLKRWAAAVSPSVKQAIFVAQGLVEVNGKEQPFLLLQCHRRGEPHSGVLAQRLKRKQFSQALVADGDPEPFCEVPCIFPA